MTETKPFIPRDKPKSWCIGIISGMVGLLLAGPIVFAGAYLSIEIAKVIGTFIFVSCVIVFFLMWLIFMVGLATGKYKVVEDKNWEDQVW